MRLLGQKNSINVRKVLWTCAELELVPQLEDWGGNTRDTSDPEFLKLNPKGLVPVLVDDGRVFSESNSICRYLAATQKRTDLLPQTPELRAEVEAWMDWQATELNSAWRAVFMGRVREHPDFQDSEVQEKSIQAWNSAMSLLDRQLDQSGAFVCGENFTLADVVLGLSTNRWELTPMHHPVLPAVDAWMTRMSTRPGFVSYCRNGVA